MHDTCAAGSMEPASPFLANLERLASGDPELCRALAAHRMAGQGSEVEVLSPLGPMLIRGMPVEPENAQEAARRWAASEDLEGTEVAVLLGLGLGYRAMALLDHGIRRVYVYEPSMAAAAAAFSSRPIGAALREGALRVVHGGPALRKALLAELARDVRLHVTAPASVASVYPAACAEMVAVVREAVASAEITDLACRMRLHTWIRHFIENLPRATSRPPVTALRREQWRDRPAFVVAAGPSLDRNIALLPEAARRGNIVAVNTSFSAAAASGARVDAVVAVEMLDVSQQLRGEPIRNTDLVVDLCAHPSLYELPARRTLCFSTDMGYPTQWLREHGFGSFPVLPAGGSVAAAAFSLALRLGANPIVLLGQDLAYPGGRAYARGTAFESLTARSVPGSGRMEFDGCEAKDAVLRASGLPSPAEWRGAVQVEAERWGGGGTVPTTPDLRHYRIWFENMAAEIGGRIGLVNATEGGSRIRGFEEVPLAEVLSALTVTPREPASPAPPPTSALDPSALRAALAKTVRRCREVGRLAGRAARETRAAARGKGKGRVAEHRLARLEQGIRSVSRSAPLLQGFARPDLDPIRREALAAQRRGHGESRASRHRRACRLYEALAQRAHELAACVAGAIGSLEGC